MMRAVMLIAGFTLATGPAHAQTSNCSWIGQIWTCQQSPQQTQLDPSIILRAGNLNNPSDANRNYWLRLQQLQQEKRDRAAAEASARAQRERDKQQAQSLARDERSQRLYSAVGDRLAAGDCEGAQALALRAGNIELASQAKAYCAGPAGK